MFSELLRLDLQVSEVLEPLQAGLVASELPDLGAELAPLGAEP